MGYGERKGKGADRGRGGHIANMGTTTLGTPTKNPTKAPPTIPSVTLPSTSPSTPTQHPTNRPTTSEPTRRPTRTPTKYQRGDGTTAVKTSWQDCIRGSRRTRGETHRVRDGDDVVLVRAKAVKIVKLVKVRHGHRPGEITLTLCWRENRENKKWSSNVDGFGGGGAEGFRAQVGHNGSWLPKGATHAFEASGSVKTDSASTAPWTITAQLETGRVVWRLRGR